MFIIIKKSTHKPPKGLIFILLLSCLVLCAQQVHARPLAPLGLGVMIGSPTGLSAQWRFTSRSALNISLAYDLRKSWILTGADYRFIHSTFHQQKGALYWGGGGMISLGGESKKKSMVETSSQIIARAPFGVEYRLSRLPWCAFLEIAPSVLIIPQVDVGVQGSLGIRYHLF